MRFTYLAVTGLVTLLLVSFCMYVVFFAPLTFTVFCARFQLFCQLKTENTHEVSIVPAGLQFSAVAENIVSPSYDAPHGYQTSVAEPTVAQMNIQGKPYVFMLLRVESKTQKGTHITLSRIPAEKFSSGNVVTPVSKWETFPDTVFSIEPPLHASSVLNTAMTAINNKLLITYQARLTTDGINEGYMLLFDPVSKKVLWNKQIQLITGYQGSSKPTGLTRVTADIIAPTGAYFDSTQGRVVIGYECTADNQSSACHGNLGTWSGLAIQEVVLSADNTVSFHSPIRLYANEIPSGMTPAKWKALGQNVWKPQSFKLSNGGTDSLIFSQIYTLASEDSPLHKTARDFPTHASFFKINHVSQALDAAVVAAQIDISSTMPPSKTWVQDLGSDSPWDQGALWNTKIYIDPFNTNPDTSNKTFVLYESWGGPYMQLSQTRDAFYGGTSFSKITAQQTEVFTQQSCNTYCSVNAVHGGDASKPYCLSASASKNDSLINGTEIPHDAIFNSVVDSITKQHIDAAYVVCADIGTSNSLPSNFDIVSTAVGAQLLGKSLKDAIPLQCNKAGQSGIALWSDLSNPVLGSKLLNAPAATVLVAGDVITSACAIGSTDVTFTQLTLTNPGQSCEIACSALGEGDGTGFRSYRAKIIAPLSPLHTVTVASYMSIDLYTVLGLAGPLWKPTTSAHMECTCGPGNELHGISSAKVAR